METETQRKRRITDRISRIMESQGKDWPDLMRPLKATYQDTYNWRTRGVPPARVGAIAKVLGVSADQLLSEPMAGESVIRAPNGARRVRVLDYKEAAAFERSLSETDGVDDGNTVSVDQALADELGEHAFAVRVAGAAMAPEYQPGDLCIIDPHQVARPGNVVLAAIDKTGGVILRKYRDRGVLPDGMALVELIPYSEDYAPILLDESSPGRIIGPVVEHRRDPRQG